MNDSLLKVKKAIIPAAGMGSRFLPVSAAIPKEIFPVFDKPLIYYAIEELKTAGVEEVYVVLSPWKLPLFESFFNLKDRFSRLHEDPTKKSVMDKLEFFNSWPKVYFVIQEEAKGLAQAIALCKSHIGLDPFFVLLPDEVFISSSKNPSQSLLATYQNFNKSVVSLFEVDSSELSHYGIAQLGNALTTNVFELVKLVEKPEPARAPSRFMLPGRYLFDQNFWNAIESELLSIETLKLNQEIHITNALDRMASDDRLLGDVVFGNRFDAGRPEGLLALSQFEFLKKG